MTADEVRERVAAIAAVARDSEVAHSDEDQLYGTYGVTIKYASDRWPPGRAELSDGAALMRRVGVKAAGRELDGRTWDEEPVHP